MIPEDKARQAAGNWMRKDGFAWYPRPEGAEQFYWHDYRTRDSGLMEQSNAAAIEDAMRPFEGRDVLFVGAGHWLCGWTDALAIRVFDAEGVITEAFRTFFGLMERLEHHALLDESDYCDREYEATLENIKWEGERLVRADAPEGWEKQVFSWLWENDPQAVYNQDDQGGYPNEKQLRACLKALDLLAPDEEEE